MENEKDLSREKESPDTQKGVVKNEGDVINPDLHAAELDPRAGGLIKFIEEQPEEIAFLEEELTKLNHDYQAFLSYNSYHRIRITNDDPRVIEKWNAIKEKSGEISSRRLLVYLAEKEVETLREESLSAGWQPAPAEDAPVTPAEDGDTAPAEPTEEPAKE